jgi:hypothetical protein
MLSTTAGLACEAADHLLPPLLLLLLLLLPPPVLLACRLSERHHCQRCAAH